MKKVAVVGSREYADLEAVHDFVLSLPAGSTVVSGGARGVDRTAELACAGRVLGLISIWPDWRKHGKKAGFLRNRDIEEISDEAEAFWDGVSSGTKSTIQLFNAAKKPVRIHR
jgi:hypothetical protein